MIYSLKLQATIVVLLCARAASADGFREVQPAPMTQPLRGSRSAETIEVTRDLARIPRADERVEFDTTSRDASSAILWEAVWQGRLDELLTLHAAMKLPLVVSAERIGMDMDRVQTAISSRVLPTPRPFIGVRGLTLHKLRRYGVGPEVLRGTRHVPFASTPGLGAFAARRIDWPDERTSSLHWRLRRFAEADSDLLCLQRLFVANRATPSGARRAPSNATTGRRIDVPPLAWARCQAHLAAQAHAIVDAIELAAQLEDPVARYGLDAPGILELLVPPTLAAGTY